MGIMQFAPDGAELATPLHSYYPLGVVIPGFVHNTLSTEIILGIFISVCSSVFLLAYIFTRFAPHTLSAGETATVLWFSLCGTIHIGLEGYFALNHYQMGSNEDILAQSWKLYALSDSRYLTQDAFVVCMETVTAFLWGPLSFVCAYLITAEHSLRHPLQFAISLGQLYGVVLYYATCAFDEVVFGQPYSRPEWLTFWGYYVFLNAFWVFIPAYLIYQSTRETSKAFKQSKAVQNGAAKLNGAAKKQNGAAKLNGLVKKD